MVIGGGLTSAHIISMALQQGACQVTWVLRKHVQVIRHELPRKTSHIKGHINFHGISSYIVQRHANIQHYHYYHLLMEPAVNIGKWDHSDVCFALSFSLLWSKRVRLKECTVQFLACTYFMFCQGFVLKAWVFTHV